MHVPRVRSAAVGCVLLLGAGVAGSSPAGAQDPANRLGVTLGGGAYKLAGGSLDHTAVGPLGEFALRFGWTERVDVEAALRYGLNWDDTQTFRNQSTALDFRVLYSHRTSGWTPQGFAGVGALTWTVYDFRGKPSPGLFDTGRVASGFKEDGHPSPLSDNNFILFAGVGVEVPVISSLAVRGGLRFDYLLQQSTDNTGASDSLRLPNEDPPDLARKRASVDANDLMPSVYVGLAYSFGSVAQAAPEVVPPPEPPPAETPPPPPVEPAPEAEQTTPAPSDTTGAESPAKPPEESTPPKPEDAPPKPEDAPPKPEDASPKPEDAAPKPENAAPKPEDAAPKPDAASPKPDDGTQAPRAETPAAPPAPDPAPAPKP